MTDREAITLCRKESAKRQRRVDKLIEQAREELWAATAPQKPTRGQRKAVEERPKRAMSLTRTCRRCKFTKSYLEFYNQMTTCKLCHKARTIELSRSPRVSTRRVRR